MVSFLFFVVLVVFVDRFPSGIFLIGKMPDESHTSNYDVTTIGLTQKVISCHSNWILFHFSFKNVSQKNIQQKNIAFKHVFRHEKKETLCCFFFSNEMSRVFNANLKQRISSLINTVYFFLNCFQKSHSFVLSCCFAIRGSF